MLPPVSFVYYAYILLCVYVYYVNLIVIVVTIINIFLSAFSLTYEGCYRDDIRNRDFIQSTKWVDTVEMTRERCASHCFLDLGYPYMGLQVSFVLLVRVCYFVYL